MDKKKNTSVRSVSEKIVEIITKDNKGVFLRQDEASDGWHVMDYAASVHKVMLALKNAEIKIRGGSERSNTKKKKKKNSPSAIHTQDLPKIKYQEGPPPPINIYRYVYEVKEGAHQIDPYTKAIINLMCNETEPNEAARALDEPRSEMTGNESDEQRQIRLQLRQRYIAAMSTGMSPVIFSRKLLKVWGGTILSRKVIVEKRSRDSGVKAGDEIVSEAKTIDNDSNNPTGRSYQTDNSKCMVISSPNDEQIQSESKENYLSREKIKDSNCVSESADFAAEEGLKMDTECPTNAKVDEDLKRKEAQTTTPPNVGEYPQRGSEETNSLAVVADEATVEL